MEKLQKVLARAGLASRREIERWIEAGRLTVNGQVATLGVRVSPTDKILLDGKSLVPSHGATTSGRVLIYNKPAGEVCTRSDPEGRPTVFDRLPALASGRWVIVGRLDLNTSGLLLFTTDGELANKLMHPSSELDREYVVRVMGQVEDDAIERMKSGVMLDDGEAKFMDVVPIKGKKKEDSINQWFYCTLMEGRNREVRRLWESQGYRISRLKRVRFGPVVLLSKVKEGAWIELSEPETAELYQMLGLTYVAPAPVAPKEKTIQQRQARKAQAYRPTRAPAKTRR